MGSKDVRLKGPIGRIRMYAGSVVKTLGTYMLDISSSTGEKFSTQVDIDRWTEMSREGGDG